MGGPFRDELESALARVDQLTGENETLRRRLAWLERRTPLDGSRAYFALPAVSAALSCGVAIGLFALRAGSQASPFAEEAASGIAADPTTRPLPVLLLPLPADESAGGGQDDLRSDGSESRRQGWDVVHRHERELRRDCSPQRHGPDLRITLRVVVSPSGRVTNAVASSEDPWVDRCVEGEVRRWEFPPGATSADRPLRFVLR